MKIVIQEQKTLEIIPCECGSYPKFVHPAIGHTDTWLECPNCKKTTFNTGGYYYAMQIPLEEARLNAVLQWNEGRLCG